MAADADSPAGKLSDTTETGSDPNNTVKWQAKPSRPQRMRRCVIPAALLVIVCVAGCSPGTDSGDPERLSPGSAQLTVNGKDAGRTEAVNCVPNSHLTTITIGDEPQVAVAMVSSIDELAVELVRFHDVNGFTGSYNDGLGGDAHVTLAGSTYQISGTAGGFNSQNPSQPSTEAFTIAVSC